MTEERRTTCRICESACGLLAQVDGSRVVGLRPDRDHPVSRGYACTKGVHFHRVHHHADRVLAPRVRTIGSEAYRDSSWDEAFAMVGQRLRALIETHGPSSVGLYSGNAAGHSFGGGLGVTAFVDGLRTPKHYSCLTLDNSEMFVVLEACLGNPTITFVADYAASDCIVLVGTDPLASQPSQAQSHPHGVVDLVEAARRAALVVIDPRRSKTAARADLHLQPRLGSDVWLIAFLAREAARERRTDALLDADDVARLAAALEPFDAARAARATGLDRADLVALADRVIGAERPLVWSGLGVLLARHGTLGWWLTLALQALLGRLDRPGGWRFERGLVDLPRAFRWTGLKGRDPEHRSRIGDYPAVLGTLAAATLADDVLTPGPDQLRALVVVGGNPAVALPNTRHALEALNALDLLVCLDLFENDTGALGHAVLPARSWLARPELPVHMANQRFGAHLGEVAAVAPPVGKARTDFDILVQLTRAAGGVPFGSRAADLALRATRAGPVGVARALVGILAPHRLPSVMRGNAAAGPFDLRGRGTDLPGGRVRLAVPEFLEALAGLTAPAGGLALLTSVRPVGRMNSWIGDGTPVARVHPDLFTAERMVVRSEHGSLTVEVRPDPSLRHDVIVLAFGSGGVNVNHLVGSTDLESFTGQPISNGTRVWLEPVSVD